MNENELYVVKDYKVDTHSILKQSLYYVVVLEIVTINTITHLYVNVILIFNLQIIEIMK